MFDKISEWVRRFVESVKLLVGFRQMMQEIIRQAMRRGIGPRPGPRMLAGAFVLLLILLAAGLGGLCAASGGGDPQPQPLAPPPPINLTLRVGEQVTKSLWCRNPVNGSPSMTIANAGTLTNSAPQIASASLVDPNGNNGQGAPIGQGLVESPRIRITGLNPSPPRARITLDLSCPELFNPTHGIGMGRHVWVKQTIFVTVVAPPPVPNPGGGGQPGGPGNPGGGPGGTGNGGAGDETPPIGPDRPTDHGGSDHSPAPEGDVPIELLPLDLHGAPDQPDCGSDCDGPSPCDMGGCATETPPACSDACDSCSDDACSEGTPPEHQCPGHDCAPPPTLEQDGGLVDETPSR